MFAAEDEPRIAVSLKDFKEIVGHADSMGLLGLAMPTDATAAMVPAADDNLFLSSEGYDRDTSRSARYTLRRVFIATV